MHRMLLELPTRIETERLVLRCYEAGDGPWYYAAGLRNREHLAQYEADNPIRSLESETDAEVLVREFAAGWAARRYFFLGAFHRATDEFVAQIYVGPVNWDVPDFTVGYFVDVDHEGYGYVTEAAKAAMRFVFHHLQAQRVSLECDDTNVRSLRVAERCGMVKEGHVRENKRHADGTLSGTLHYGLLRREFEALDLGG